MSAAMASKIDFDKYRLRRLVERLTEAGLVEVHDEPVALADLSAIIEATDQAVLFRKAGPEQQELVATVMGGREHLAVAFGVEQRELGREVARRLAQPAASVEVPQTDAPVQEIVVEGEDADFSVLPFHIQHQLDGGPYISSGIDFVVDPESGETNVGCRRLMLRGRREAGVNLTAPSDLREIYLKCVERGERLPLSFTVGSHPFDFVASMLRFPGEEIGLIGKVRGEPVPLVRCRTNDLLVPADAEMVFEGYFDERGYVDLEGPFGEYMGFYGPMHPDPTFHLTAITMRSDALNQTLMHGSGRGLARTDAGNFGAIMGEAQGWNLLKSTVAEPTAVFVPPSSNGIYHMYAAIRQQAPGEGRKAVEALLGLPMIKHVFVTDSEVDIFSADQREWALASRFQAERDLIVRTDQVAMGMDLSLGCAETGSRAGFDLTLPFERQGELLTTVCGAPSFTKQARFQTVEQALEAEPHYFAQLMEALGSRDGREIMLELVEMKEAGKVHRLENGEYALQGPPDG